jgi:predicted RNA-binding Zn ribbon-like protein
MGDEAPKQPFDFCGGYLAIDFANTVDGRSGAAPVERLTGYEALLAFAEQAAIVGADQARQLRVWARANPEAAAAITSRARDLRELLYRAFTAVADGKPPDPRDLDGLTRWWGALAIAPDWSWGWSAGRDAPDAMLGQILVSAVELLRSARRERVRTCGADTCRWLFLDSSKNGSRRWCDMNQCGNRTKARRFYRRQRGGEAES